jgi:BolA protein
MPEGTVERIRDRLAVLAPVEVVIEDESALHAGHPGAASGGGHYRLRVISARFLGESRMTRHRLVYDALADLMQREIHALAMTLLAPGEAERPAPHSEHTSGH